MSTRNGRYSEQGEAPAASPPLEPATQSPTFVVSDSALRAALDAVVHDSLQPWAVGLGLLYLILALSYPFAFPPGIAVPLTLAAGVTATVLLGVSLLLRRWSPPVQWAHPLAVNIAGLALGNVLLHLFLVLDPMQTASLILLVIGAGLFFLSVRWLALVLATTWIGWGAVVWVAPASPGWLHFGFALYAATVLSVLLHTMRLRTYSRLEQLRLQSEHKSVAMEEALLAVRQSRTDLARRVAARTAELAASEERYRDLFENANDALVSLTLEGTIFQVNQETLKLSGYSQEEALGQHFSKFITAASVPLVEERILRSLAGKEVPRFFELEWIYKDRSVLLVEGQYRFIRNTAGQPTSIEASFRDITERKQAEETLRRYAERLKALHQLDQAILEAVSPVAIAQAALRHVRSLIPCQRTSVVLFDFAAGTGTIMATDSVKETNYGPGVQFALATTADELLLLRQGQVVLVDDLPSLPQPSPALRARRDEGLRTFLVTPLLVHGELIGSLNLWADLPGHFTAEDIAIAREVSTGLAVALQQARLREQVQQHAADLEQKVAERTAELQERQRFIEQIANTTPTILYLYDLIRNRIVYLNSYIVEVLGYTREGVTQASKGSVIDFIHPDDLGQVVERLRRYSTAKDGEVFLLEYRMRHRHGEWRWLRDQATVFARTADGVPFQVLGSAEDITERRELEQRLRESEKLAAMGRLVASVAHEINNPLAGIKNSFLLVKDAIPPTYPHYKFVGRIEKEINRIARIIRELFTLYRPQREKASEVRLVEMLEDIVPLLEEKSHKHQVAVRLDVPDRSAVAVVSESALRQVVFNLVRNAIEASSPGQEVTVTVAVTTEWSRIEVIDHGGGITPEVGARIFEPFFTTKSDWSEGGLGLGLAITKSLVDTMGGRLSFESQPGQGTTFRVEVPGTQPLP